MNQYITPTVWIVDDDEDDQLFICSAFQDGQPAIDTLSLKDGEELLPKLADSVALPRLILLDINMPRKNGFEALAEVRSEQLYADLPIVMLTTSSSEQDKDRCLALGASGFMTKPLSYEQLRELAQTLTHQWKLDQEP